jgi:hypothetical protein
MVEVVVSLLQDKMNKLRKKASAINILKTGDRYLAGSNGHYYLE